MSRRKRGSAHIRSRKSGASVCPGCSALLDGWTGASLDGDFEDKLELKGRPSMCGYCGVLLIFADNAGRVRAMTEAERNSVRFAPIVEKLYAGWREKLAVEAAKFTKAKWN